MTSNNNNFNFSVRESRQAKLCESLCNFNISEEDNIKLYALYRQFMFGDCNVDNPSDLAKSQKYDAWRLLNGKSKPEAMGEYLDLLERVKKNSKFS